MTIRKQLENLSKQIDASAKTSSGIAEEKQQPEPEVFKPIRNNPRPQWSFNGVDYHTPFHNRPIFEDQSRYWHDFYKEMNP